MTDEQRAEVEHAARKLARQEGLEIGAHEPSDTGTGDYQSLVYSTVPETVYFKNDMAIERCIDVRATALRHTIRGASGPARERLEFSVYASMTVKMDGKILASYWLAHWRGGAWTDWYYTDPND